MNKFKERLLREVKRLEEECAPIKKALRKVKNPDDKEEVFGVLFAALSKELNKELTVELKEGLNNYDTLRN